MPLFELLILIALIGLAWFRPRAVWPGIGFAQRMLRKLASWPGGAAVGVGVAVLIFEFIIGWYIHLPVPALHDEFSYLLAGDTFAEGRLTNPVHAFWEHFETYHVIHQPSYQSKYPPAQGLTLAVGQKLTGLPIVGVWLTLALACGAVVWMAEAWLPRRWALVAGLLLAVNFKLLRFWGQTYMGGGVALLGGALVFGALPRLQKRWRTRFAVLLVCGLVILANSRPYEGGVAALPALAVVLMTAWRNRKQLVAEPVNWLVPTATLLCGVCATLYYHQQVTGSPWRMPYQVWHATYQTGDFWQTTLLASTQTTIPTERPARVIGSGPTAEDWQVWFARKGGFTRKLAQQSSFYAGWLLALPLLVALAWPVVRLVMRKHTTDALAASPSTARAVTTDGPDRPCGAATDAARATPTGRVFWVELFSQPLHSSAGRSAFAFITCGLVCAAICFQGTNGHPHYSAPIAGLLMVIIAQGLRRMQTWSWSGSRRGMILTHGLVAGSLLITALYTLTEWLPRPVPQEMAWSLRRANMEERLTQTAQADLVFVRYPRVEETGLHWEEWVYNRAALDHAPVVWARDLGPDKNLDLARYFSDRQCWLLDPTTDRLERLAWKEGVDGPRLISTGGIGEPTHLSSRTEQRRR